MNNLFNLPQCAGHIAPLADASVGQRTIAQHEIPARHGMHCFGRHGLSVQRGITRIRGKIGIVDRERRVQIEYRDIRVHASRKVAFVGKSHPARGITADQRQDLFQSNVTLAGFRQQGGQECIKARKPWLRSPDAAVLGAARAVDVIGCDGVYLARVDPCPKRITVCRRTQGGLTLPIALMSLSVSCVKYWMQVSIDTSEPAARC